MPIIWTLEGEWKQHNAAVEAIVTYCDYVEGGPLWGWPKRSVLRDGEDDASIKPDGGIKQQERPGLSLWEKKRQENRTHILTAPKPKICF